MSGRTISQQFAPSVGSRSRLVNLGNTGVELTSQRAKLFVKPVMINVPAFPSRPRVSGIVRGVLAMHG